MPLRVIFRTSGPESKLCARMPTAVDLAVVAGCGRDSIFVGLGLIHFEAIEFGGVLAEDFLPFVVTDGLKIIGNFLPRVGPERGAVGKIRRPENIVHADIMAMSNAETIVDECRVELAAEIVAWFVGQLGSERRATEAYSSGVEAFVDTE